MKDNKNDNMEGMSEYNLLRRIIFADDDNKKVYLP